MRAHSRDKSDAAGTILPLFQAAEEKKQDFAAVELA